MEWIDIITTVGFPIAACIFMAKQNIVLTDTITSLKETLAKIDLRLGSLERKVGTNEGQD